MPLRFVLCSLRVRPDQQLNSVHFANQVFAVLRVFLRVSASPRQMDAFPFWFRPRRVRERFPELQLT